MIINLLHVIDINENFFIDNHIIVESVANEIYIMKTCRHENIIEYIDSYKVIINTIRFQIWVKFL